MEFEPSETFLGLREQLIRAGALFVDNSFPAVGSSIGGKYAADSRIQWLRPTQITDDPQFIIQGMTRQDIFQGLIRDCFLLAGAASIGVTNPALLYRVVPPGQNFGIQYTGMFRFYFWRYDRWVEVIIDDRLPTIRGKLIMSRNRNKGNKNEFWVALMEKAFAKLNGSYINIDTGFVNEAMSDLTGGVGEIIEVVGYRSNPDNLFALLERTVGMSSFMSCAVNIEPAKNLELEASLDNGLYYGHAYSITRLAKVEYKGKPTNLIRLRNPWGRKEWTGSWGDKSRKWKKISEVAKIKLDFHKKEDGEFWMDFDDWVDNFEGLYLCHLTPDAMVGEISRDMVRSNWNQQLFNGEWVPGVSAGGCGNRPHRRLFWTNPQFLLDLTKAVDGNGDGKISLVISLTQKNRTDETNEYINFLMFKIRKKVDTSAPRTFGPDDAKPLKRNKDFINVRDVSDHFRYKPGRYLVMPCTFKPHRPGTFTLRIFSETGGKPPTALTGLYF